MKKRSPANNIKATVPPNTSVTPEFEEESIARGRPLGAKNIKVEVIVEISRCPSCQSTERSDYTNKSELEFGGMRGGQPYTHVVWQSTRCLQCGQARRDKTFENRVETDEPDPENGI